MSDSYQILAPHYNEVMEHVDYLKWARFLDSAFKKYQVVPKCVLELAAGTGSLRAAWKNKPKNYIISDFSQPMIKQADLRDGPRVVADMKTLPFKSSQFNLTICLYDSFNYLMSKREMESCLAEVNRVTQDGGFFLFDVITEQMCLEFFDDFLDYQETTNGVQIIRQSNYDLETRLQTNQFIYFIPQGEDLYQKQEDFHTQKIWWPKEIEEVAKKVGWELIALMGDFTVENSREDSLRLNFLLRKS